MHWPVRELSCPRGSWRMVAQVGNPTAQLGSLSLWPHGDGTNTARIFFQPQTDETCPCCIPYNKPAPQAPAFECSVLCQVVQFWELAKPLGQKACPAEVGLWVRIRAAAPLCFHPGGFVSCPPCWMFPQPLAEPLQLSSSLPCPVGLFPRIRGPESLAAFLLGIWSQQC